MKRLKALIHKDIALTSKNYFFYVTLFFAVLMIVVINFVVPEDTSIESKAYVVFEYEVPEAMVAEYEAAGSVILSDRNELDTVLKENIQSFGMILVDPVTVEWRLQGHENDKYKELMALNTSFMYGEYQGSVDVTTTDLKDFTIIEDPPFNKLLLPLFLVMEPALLGMFLIATMIFSEKEEETLTVYATTPGGIQQFILSKTIVMMLLGLFSLLLTSIAVLGLSANYFWLILLTIVGSFMGSALGLLLASFFKNIAGAMMWIIFGSLILSMPFASYLAPGFTPFWMKLMPTYYMLFAYKEASFPTGNPLIIYQTLGITLAVGLVAYGLSLVRYHRTFTAR